MSSVHTTLRVLEEVGHRQSVGVSELARAMALPKSTVQRCLITLREAGWLAIADERSRWVVTSKPFEIGPRAIGTDKIREVSQPFIEELRQRTDETVHLSVRSRDSIVIVSREDSSQPVRTYVELGTQAPLHATSSGLAILATVSDEEIDRIIGRGLAACTSTTIVEANNLRHEIVQTRGRGYSVNPDPGGGPESAHLELPWSPPGAARSPRLLSRYRRADSRFGKPLLGFVRGDNCHEHRSRTGLVVRLITSGHSATRSTVP